MKNIKFRTLLIKKDPRCKIYLKTAGFFPHCKPTHMTDSMTCPHTKSHISLKILSVSSILTTTVRSAEERFVMERMATRGFGNKRLVCRCRQRSAGCRGCAQTATWRRATSGDRVVRTLVCASCFPHMFRLTSLGVSSVSLVCRSIAAMRSAFVSQRSSTPGFLLTHAAQSPVFANVCRRLTSSAAAAASMSTRRRSTGQRSR